VRCTVRDSRRATCAAAHGDSHEGNAAIFAFCDSNTLLEPADLAAELFAVDLLYVSNLGNESADCFPELVRRAKADALVPTLTVAVGEGGNTSRPASSRRPSQPATSRRRSR
jgi:ribokinase